MKKEKKQTVGNRSGARTKKWQNDEKWQKRKKTKRRKLGWRATPKKPKSSQPATPRARAARARAVLGLRPKMGTFCGRVPLRFTSICGVIFWSFLKPPKIGKKVTHFGARSPQVSVVFWCHFFVIFCHLSSRAFFHCIRVFFSFFLFFFSPFFPPFFPLHMRARARYTVIPSLRSGGLETIKNAYEKNKV